MGIFHPYIHPYFTWLFWGLKTPPMWPHICPKLLVNVTDKRKSLQLYNFQKKWTSPRPNGHVDDKNVELGDDVDAGHSDDEDAGQGDDEDAEHGDDEDAGQGDVTGKESNWQNWLW